MTREDAISIMKVIVHMLEEKYDTDRIEDAVDMAIKALKQEPCEDAISRSDTIEWLKKVTVTDGITFETGFKQILTDIQNMPPVTPKPKVGHWIEHEHNGIAYIECSKCLTWFLRAYLTRNSYCPNCGARMVESQESED